jgi:SH3-like domain-containing protein
MAARDRGRRRILIAIGGATLAAMIASTAGAADQGLPVPRFASLKSDEVNLRAGPGERYPIEWVLTRKDMPVEIVREFANWRQVRDWQGDEGWVHERMVVGKRNVVVTGPVRALHRDPDAGAPLVARAEPGVVARLLECRGAWCRIEADATSGWVRRSDIWGVLPDETFP